MTIRPRRTRAGPPTNRRCLIVAVASCFAQILALIDRTDWVRAKGVRTLFLSAG